MKMRISPFALLRIPQFPVNANLEHSWLALKDSISTSSPSFYDIIRPIEHIKLTDVDGKIAYTLWKYFNRAKYRGIPYGKFAGYAVASLKQIPISEKQMRISAVQQIHSYPDWANVEEVDKSEQQMFNSDRRYIANSNTYVVDNCIRYISQVNQNFELAEISTDQNILTILEYCTYPIHFNDLLLRAHKMSINPKEIQNLIKDMLHLGLLFTDLNPSIIDEDLGSLNIPKEKNIKTYDLAEREVLSGSIDQTTLASIPSYIDFLKDVIPKNNMRAITSFKEAFKLKYEQQEVQLLRVLDPEIGLGYDELETSSDTDALIESLSSRMTSSADPYQQTYDEDLKSFLYNAIYATSGNREAVIDLRDYKQQQSAKKLPNSITVLTHVSEDLVIPNYIGGCTSNAMMGRFTLSNNQVLAHCRSTALIESESNPDVLFFDFGYTAEGSVDNINRRKSIYDYEAMMLSYTNGVDLIPMNDVYLTIKQDELILFSKKHQKRIIPRLASAYNHKRSDLSLFRFLCDIQHQNVQSNLNFQIKDILPNLNFYPRIQYNNVVASPSQWRIQVNKPIVAQLEDNQVSQCFLAGSSDQMLHFDCKNPQDLSAFLQFASQQEDFYVYEAFSTDCATVIDENENSYQAQIQLMFYHKDRLYEPYIPSSTPPAKEESKVILQGNDWLYFEVYIHPSRADSILCDQVSTFLNAYAEAFKCFFFIRYNHPTSHLRLRFQLKQPKYGYFYIEQFTELFRPAIISGLVSDIQIKPYIRELDRYGEERITETEHHFEQSSKLVLDIIANGYSTSDKYNSCISLARSMLDSLDLNLREQQHMVKEIQDAFIREHNFSNAELKLINKEFADAARQGNRTIVDHADLRSIKESFFKMIKRSETSISRKLFRDLFHMHVNRMFSANQRLHELVIYSVLYKDLLRNGYSSKV